MADLEIELKVDGQTHSVAAPLFVTFGGSLTTRMLAKTPQAGYELWLDTSNTDRVIIGEAPVGTTNTASTAWNWIDLPLVNGAVVGKIETHSGEAWDDR